MTEPEKSKTDTGSRWLRCLGRLTFTAPMAAACLLLALGDPAPLTVTVVVVGLWLWLAASVVAGIVRAAKAVEAAASQPSGNINPFYFMRRIPPHLCVDQPAVAGRSDGGVIRDRRAGPCQYNGDISVRTAGNEPRT